MTATSNFLTSLGADQKRILFKKLEEKRAEQAALVPLSFAQERLWFTEQLQPNTATYNISIALRFKGSLQPEVLKESIAEIVRRHDILRASFRSVGGKAVQVIAPASASILFPITDLTRLPEEERELRALEIIRHEAQRPFDLSNEKLIRTNLIKVGAEDHFLAVTMHHIISDGWSMKIFIRELGIYYSAFIQSQSAPLEPLPIQYPDFAVWQRETLTEELFRERVNYWKKKLANAPPLLDLPSDYPRPLTPTGHGAVEHYEISDEIVRRVREFARARGTTPFIVYLALFQVLLHRYSGQADILVGTPVGVRPRVETENLIGFFINTVVLRANFENNPSFSEFLRSCGQVACEAYSHQDVPFEKIVEELHPQRVAAHTPLFQVAFVLADDLSSQWKNPDLEVTIDEVESDTAKFDLTLFIKEQQNRISLEYNTDLFGPATIRRFLKHFCQLMEGVLRNPDQPVGNIPILDWTEKNRLLHEWNTTEKPYPKETPVHRLFEMQALKTPQAVAIELEKKQLTYQELNLRSNQLAHHLVRCGIKPKDIVALCLDRSIEMVIGMLAILKAGGTYLPLDSAYPAERLVYMIKDARAKVLITRDSLAALFSEAIQTIISVDGGKEGIAAEPADNLAVQIRSENIAYIIYTSGSTGRPKGSLIPHQGISRLVLNTNYIKLDADDVVAQVSNCSFDAATFEIWGALLNGGKLVILPQDLILSPEDFKRALREYRVSALFVTTALFNLLSIRLPSVFTGVKNVLFGGEAAEPKAARRILEQSKPGRLLNMYGPTETTTFATWFEVKEVGDNVVSLPIGLPISNTKVYILDRFMEPVPIGVAGDLYIGGDGVSHGYLNLPEFTSKAFVDHFLPSHGRLYKTGDLARHRDDGNIEFLGRRDCQVKIRGFRIELREIEAALDEHPGVACSAVIVREDSPGDKRIAAYFVPAADSSIRDRELLTYLKKKLPEYMLPSAIIALKELPLTANGKLDQAALPAISPSVSGVSARYQGPSSPLEAELIELWEELLATKPIGVRDNFFDLGGHSLLAVKMMGRVEELCGHKLPLSSLFAAATIEDLAKALLEREKRSSSSRLVLIQKGDSRRPPFFFFHGDYEGGGFYSKKLARGLGPDQPFYILEPHGVDGAPVPETIEAMAISYLGMLQEVEFDGPYLLGGFCNGGLVAFEVARHLVAQGKKVDLLVLLDAFAINFTVLYRTIHCLGFCFGLSRNTRIETFLEIRNTLVRIDRWWRLQKADAILRVQAKAKVFFQKFCRQWLSWSRMKREEAIALRLAHETQKPNHSDIATAYCRAVGRFFPKMYPGRVTLFRLIHSPAPFSKDPMMGWGKVANEVRLVYVPGEHLTMLTKHVDILAENFKRLIEKTLKPRENKGEGSGVSGL